MEEVIAKPRMVASQIHMECGSLLPLSVRELAPVIIKNITADDISETAFLTKF